MRRISIITFLIAPLIAFSSEQPSDEYQASTVEELVSAIGSNRTIYLTGESYDLTEWENLLEEQQKQLPEKPLLSTDPKEDLSYRFDDLCIADLENLSLIGADEHKKAELYVLDAARDVLPIRNSKNIRLENLKLGHRVEPGHCDGAVIQADFVDGLEILNCDLYGCGTYGLDLMGSFRVTIKDSRIHDCTYGILFSQASGDLSLEAVAVDNCAGGMHFYSSNRVKVENCRFEGIFDEASGILARIEKCPGDLQKIAHYWDNAENLLIRDDDSLLERLDLEQPSFLWKCNKRIACSSGAIVGSWTVVPFKLDLETVIDLPTDELADRLGDNSNVGYCCAASVKIDAIRLKTEWTMAQESIEYVSLLDSWRDAIAQFQQGLAETGYYFGGGGSIWSRIMDNNAVEREQFIAEWAEALIDLEEDQRPSIGNLIEEIWHHEIQELYEEWYYVDEEDGRPEQDEVSLRKNYPMPVSELEVLFSRLKSEDARNALMILLSGESEWHRREVEGKTWFPVTKLHGESESPKSGGDSEEASTTLYPGSRYSFPETGVVYIVREDDNVADIASTHRSQVAWILEANRVSDFAELKVGSKIFIPIPE